MDHSKEPSLAMQELQDGYVSADRAAAENHTASTSEPNHLAGLRLGVVIVGSLSVSLLYGAR